MAGVVEGRPLHLVDREEDGLGRTLNALVLGGNMVRTRLVAGHLGHHHPVLLGLLWG